MNMGIKERKKREKKLRIRQITTAARKVIADKGRRETRMSDIAKEAELSPGTIYLYFKTKEELLSIMALKVFEFIDLGLERFKEHVKLLPIEGRMDALFEVLNDTYMHDPELMLNALKLQGNEMLKNSSIELQAMINSKLNNVVLKMAEILRCDNNTSDAHNRTDKLAEILWSMFTGMVLVKERERYLNGRKVKDLFAELKLTGNLLLNGIEDGSKNCFMKESLGSCCKKDSERCNCHPDFGMRIYRPNSNGI